MGEPFLFGATPTNKVLLGLQESRVQSFSATAKVKGVGSLALLENARCYTAVGKGVFVS